MNYYRSHIGIIGAGFVGNAILQNYSRLEQVISIRDPAKGYNASYDELKECDGIFICVPSPSNPDGSCDSSILEDVLSNFKDYDGVLISKVTATPDVYEKLQKEYKNLVYVPEFLTAANSVQDYADENWVIIGGNVMAYQREAKRLISQSKKELTAEFCSIGEAALVKYAINSFLATKVVFMNEFANIANTKGYDWNKISHLINLDKRIGISHMRVPGPDGYYGFGGMCFPKDTSAILHYANKIDCDLNVLSTAVKKNTLLRLQKPK